MSDYSDPEDSLDFYHPYHDWWNPFDSPDDYEDYLFYDGCDDSYDDCDLDDASNSVTKDVELATYMEHLTTGLRNLQNQKTFCDVTLKVEGKSFEAHKNILAASSDYFMAMFTSGFQEAGRAEVTIEGDSSIFEYLLEFAYTGVIKDLSPDTVGDVMSMAGYLQFTHALSMCKTFVTKKYAWDQKAISLQKAYEISLLAESYGLELVDLIKRSKLYMLENFIFLSKKEAFVEETSFECLEYCLDSFNNSTRTVAGYTDQDILTIITTWLKHNQDERKQHAHTLLKKLRLGLIPTDVVEKLRDSPEMKELIDCRMLLDEVLGLKLADMPEWLTDIPIHMSHPQLFAKRNTAVSIVALGGLKNQNRSIKLKNTYVTWQSCERDIPVLPEKLSNHGSVVVNGHLFVTGGIVPKPNQQQPHNSRGNNSNKKKNSIMASKMNDKSFWFDAGIKKWHELAPMKRGRKNLALVHMDDLVYALGGMTTRGGALYNVDCYSLTTREWCELPRMPCQIREPSAVAFNGNVLVYGMRDMINTYVLMMYVPGSSNTASSSSGPDQGIWYLLRTEKLSGSQATGVFKPVLNVHNGKCYRVVYEAIQNSDAASDKRNDDNVKRKARVVEVVFDLEAEVPTATIGMEEKQNEELIKRVIGTVNFCIADRLFVNACGLVHDMGLTVDDVASKKAEDHLWINVKKPNDIYGSSVVLYTYMDS
ncbi:kelch-like protein 15 [Amphiura filiformis]|uniref:kelch-like protein 15 n=1 Tax=Amphiura filiformis TaxID=82378 RepID=UPI003B222A23